ncbi:MAG: hypothetical protein IKA35_02350 [Bacteroidaceae bacterium]|nr:hypothetical protein [Bacteroidaceae bacterium]
MLVRTALCHFTALCTTITVKLTDNKTLFCHFDRAKRREIYSGVTEILHSVEYDNLDTSHTFGMTHCATISCPIFE